MRTAAIAAAGTGQCERTERHAGWATSIGMTTLLLALGESPHSLGRDIIAGIGGSLAAFPGALSAFRVVESYLSRNR